MGNVVRVDLDKTHVDTWAYENHDGFLETVTQVEPHYVEIADQFENGFSVYNEDIPNLIKALQAAYDANGKTS